jgi:predicted transposase/invertase (TIGR01784 family)
MQDPFEQAEIAHYSESERRQYFESQKEYWDNYSIMTTALNKGLRQGRAEGRAEGLAEGEAKANRENARRMKAKGYAIHDIAEVTGLSEEEIERM